MNRPQNLPTAYAYPFPIMYRAHDQIIHTAEHPFCWDIHCPCHWDRSSEGREYRWDYIDSPLDEGLITRQEADRLYFDKQI